MLAFIEKCGCRIKVSGDRFTISNIPDWQTYRYCQDNLDKLMLIAVTENMLREAPEPIRFKQGRDNKCPHCRNYNSPRCPYKFSSHKIPHGTFVGGCEKWVESESIYFREITDSPKVQRLGNKQHRPVKQMNIFQLCQIDCQS